MTVLFEMDLKGRLRTGFQRRIMRERGIKCLLTVHVDYMLKELLGYIGLSGI